MVCVGMWYRTAKFSSFILNNKRENIKKYQLNVLFGNIEANINRISKTKTKTKENP